MTIMKKNKEKKTGKQGTFRRIYNFYRRDFDYNLINKFIYVDAKSALDYYAKETQNSKSKGNKNFFLFIKNIFLAFLSKLSPFNRIFYTFSLIVFALGVLNSNWNYVIVSFLSINIMLALELYEKLSAKEELQIARKIQIDLISNPFPTNKYFEISAFSDPAKEVGGDYYEFFNNAKSDETIFIIADISGKGMSAALIMIQLQSAIKLLLRSSSFCESILIDLNLTLCESFKNRYFLTAILGKISSDGTIYFCRAGHLPMLRYSAREKKIYQFTPSGIGVGLTKNSVFDSSIKEIEVETEKDDLIILYTDGIIEAMNPRKELFGDKLFHDVIIANASQSPSYICNEIKRRLANFRGVAPQSDDSTLIVMKRF